MLKKTLFLPADVTESLLTGFFDFYTVESKIKIQCNLSRHKHKRLLTFGFEWGSNPRGASEIMILPHLCKTNPVRMEA